MADVFHLGLTKDMLGGATVAIVPGDPGRVERIASVLDDAAFLASTREFTSYLGHVGRTRSLSAPRGSADRLLRSRSRSSRSSGSARSYGWAPPAPFNPTSRWAR